ncbi:MAG: peptidoglycan-binding domain-containing protein [Gaiellaceae bacterium]
MPVHVGSNGGLVSVWQKTMLARFPSYAKATDGSPLKIDGYYGDDDANVWREYQTRVGETVTGIVSDDDLVALGVMPVAYTVQGTGVDMWTGPPADTARGALDLVKWQPIGNYPAAPFPMWASIMQGVTELRVQIRKYEQQHPRHRKVLIGYSQGAIVVGLVFLLDFQAENGEFHHLLDTVKLGITWGNPMRELHKANGNAAAGWPIPEGQGILKTRQTNTPDFWLDFAHGANSSWGRDLYTDTEAGDATGSDETAICDFIMSEHWYSGPVSIVKRILAIPGSPIDGAWGVCESILQAGMFFGGQCGPHTDYDINPAITALRNAVTAT